MKRGLVVRVEIPGQAYDMQNMNFSSSKLFKHEQRVSANMYRQNDNIKKRRRHEAREVRTRTKARKRGRIIIMPIQQAIPSLPDPVRLSDI